MIPVHLAVSRLTSLWRDSAPHSLTSHLRFALFSPHCGFTEDTFPNLNSHIFLPHLNTAVLFPPTLNQLTFKI